MTSINNCNFTGSTIKFDGAVVSTVETLGEALLENARAINNLATFLKCSSVNIGPLLQIDDNPKDADKQEVDHE